MHRQFYVLDTILKGGIVEANNARNIRLGLRFTYGKYFTQMFQNVVNK